MKAKELMIGNYLTIENPKSWAELKGKIMRLSAINYNTDLDMFPNSPHHLSLFEETRYSREYSQMIEFVKPIELSEELLLKLGFDWVEEVGGYCNKDHIVYELNYGNFEIHFFCSNDKQSRKIIRYVHELQNTCFILTGDEIKFKI